MTMTRMLARYVLALDARPLEGARLEAAKRFFADVCACMLAGASQPGMEAALRYARRYGGPAECSVPGRPGERTDAATAAMLGGVAAHICDYDDMSVTMNGHPSAVTAPVALALGEKLNASGRRVLAAYAAGVEVDSILGKLCGPAGLDPRWNPTSLLGVFGATAAAGLLLGLDERTRADAFGIAAGEAGGAKANYGTPAKDLTVGHAAAKGVFAAETAACGFSANPEALEGENGLLRIVAPGADCAALERVIAEHRSDFLEPGLVMKPYPSCRGNHNGIDCILRLLAEEPIERERIQKIVCRLQDTAYRMDLYPVPETPAQGKFSLGYCIGKVLEHGGVCMADFTGERIADPAAMAWLEKVELEPDGRFTPENAVFGAEVEVRLDDGRAYSRRGSYAKGDPRNPMSGAEAAQKLRQCVPEHWTDDRRDALSRTLGRLESLDSIRTLTGLLSGSPD